MAVGNPFFDQLRTFCQRLDEDVAHLKTAFKVPDGHKPEKYDKGLRKIQEGAADLVKMSESIEEKLASVNSGTKSLDAAWEGVSKKTEEIERIEKQLIEIGYQPLKICTNSEKNADKKQADETGQKHSLTKDLPKSPFLSGIGQKATNNQIPALAISEALDMHSDGTEKCIAHKNSTFNILSPVYESSVNHLTPNTKRRTEKWLAEVQSNFTVTPDVVSANNLRVTYARNVYDEDTSFSEKEGGEYIRPLRTQKNYFTAGGVEDCENVEQAANMDLTERSATGQDLSNTSVSMQHVLSVREHLHTMVNLTQGRKNSNDKPLKSTPDEPVLSCKFNGMCKKHETVTPEEPHCSNQLITRDQRKTCTPEDPVSNLPTASCVGSKQEASTLMPELHIATVSQFPKFNGSPPSPELSEQTKKFLSLHRHNLKSSQHGVSCQKMPCNQIASGRDTRLKGSVASQTDARTNTPVDPKDTENTCVQVEKKVQKTGEQYFKACNDNLQPVDDVPESPQFSEVTQRILLGSFK